MKRGYLAILLLVAGISCNALAQPSRGPIAFIDFEQVFTNYYKAKLSNEQLLEMSDAINREQAKMMLQFDALQRELKDLRDKVMQEGLVESDKRSLRADLDAKLVELRRQEEKIKYFNETQQKRWQEQNTRVRGEIISELRKKLAAFGKARRFQAIIDSSQINDRGVPGALYFDPEFDVTAQAILYVNEF